MNFINLLAINKFIKFNFIGIVLMFRVSLGMGLLTI